ncbi:hypothetical protein ACFLQN_02705 [Candidatus Aenigmatarchaeota archaeon]
MEGPEENNSKTEKKETSDISVSNHIVPFEVNKKLAEGEFGVGVNTMFQEFFHGSDKIVRKDPYKQYWGEPDNILKSMAKGIFFRWIKREKEWWHRVK